MREINTDIKTPAGLLGLCIISNHHVKQHKQSDLKRAKKTNNKTLLIKTNVKRMMCT